METKTKMKKAFAMCPFYGEKLVFAIEWNHAPTGRPVFYCKNKKCKHCHNDEETEYFVLGNKDNYGKFN